MNNLNLFWDEFKKIQHAKKYGILPANLVRKYENLQKIANELNDDERSSHPYIMKIINGTTITNKFNKKLYFKLGE